MADAPVATNSELQERRRLRRAMLLLGAIALGIVVVGYLLYPRPQPVTPIAIDEVVSIDLELTPTSGGQSDVAKTVEQASQFAPLLEVLNTGLETSDHKCADTGRVVVRFRSGEVWHYGLLSGHAEPYYQFRRYEGLGYRIYQVDRTAFTQVMKNLGVERVDDVRPEL